MHARVMQMCKGRLVSGRGADRPAPRASLQNSRASVRPKDLNLYREARVSKSDEEAGDVADWLKATCPHRIRGAVRKLGIFRFPPESLAGGRVPVHRVVYLHPFCSYARSCVLMSTGESDTQR